MKKRKGEVVDREGNILKKAKVSDLAEGEANNNKHGQLVRTVKVLLQKEQTRLSGMLKFYIQFISCCFEIHVWDWNCNFVSQMMCKCCILVDARFTMDIPSQYMHCCLVLFCEVYCVIV